MVSITALVADIDFRHGEHGVFLLEQVESLQGRFDRFQPLAIEAFQMRQGQIEDRSGARCGEPGTREPRDDWGRDRRPRGLPSGAR